MFGRHLGNTNSLLEPLVYEPEKNLQGMLAHFLTEKVFIDDEDGKCCDVTEKVFIDDEDGKPTSSPRRSSSMTGTVSALTSPEVSIDDQVGKWYV